MGRKTRPAQTSHTPRTAERTATAAAGIFFFNKKQNKKHTTNASQGHRTYHKLRVPVTRPVSHQVRQELSLRHCCRPEQGAKHTSLIVSRSTHRGAEAIGTLYRGCTVPLVTRATIWTKVLPLEQ